MAVAFVSDLPMTTEQVGAILQTLNLGGKPAEGQILHLDGPFGNGSRIVDVWESREAYERFVQQHVAPAMQKAGVNIQIPEPQFFEVNTLLK